MKLDLGCGNNLPEGEDWVGIDRVESSDAKYVKDLEESPELPFVVSSCEKVRARHSLEHLSEDSLDQLLEEVHRVLWSDGVFEVTLPHFLSWNSATVDHKQVCGRNFFDLYGRHDFSNQRSDLFEVDDVEFVLEKNLELVRILSKVFSSRTIATYIPNSVREVKFTLQPIKGEDAS